MFRCVINLAGRASRLESLESPRTEDWSHWSPVWTKEVLMMIRSPDSPGLTKHSHCMARGQFLREYKGNEGAIMPINMLVRWEVRGPGGMMEVLVVRLVLDTWSPDCWLDCSLWLWWWGLVAVPGLSGATTGPDSPCLPPHCWPSTQLMLSGRSGETSGGQWCGDQTTHTSHQPHRVSDCSQAGASGHSPREPVRLCPLPGGPPWGGARGGRVRGVQGGRMGKEDSSPGPLLVCEEHSQHNHQEKVGVSQRVRDFPGPEELIK